MAHNSILNSIKKNLGLSDSYTAFDQDIIMYINSTFGSLNQLGIGPEDSFSIEDSTAEWETLDLPTNQLGMVQTYIYLKVKILFDPPTSSFLLEALKQQIEEHEVRLHYAREATIDHSPESSDSESIVYVPLPSYMEGGYD